MTAAVYVPPLYTINEIKVYKNTQIKLYDEYELNHLEKEFNEVLDLLDLFSEHENPEKIKKLLKKEKYYCEKFEPKIKESRRMLKNTEKRIDYNLERCFEQY